MNYSSLDEVPEPRIQAALDFMGAVVRLTPSRTATCIAQLIADECLLKGESALTHKEFERRTGTCRRTVQVAIRRLLDRRVIQRVRRTDEGNSIYACLWERGAELRAQKEERAHGGR